MTFSAGPTVHDVQRVRVWTESTFATDGTGTLSNFKDVPMKEGSMGTFKLTQETIDPGSIVQTRWNYRQEILGKKHCELSFTMPLAPTGTEAGNSTAAVAGALGVILKAIMGGEQLGTGTRAKSGWTSTSGTVTTGAGANLLAGSSLGWVNSSSQLEAREIKQRSTDTLTTKLAFSGTPANTDVLYASATYYLTGSPDTSLQFIIEGPELQDRWLMLGAQGSMTLSLPIGADNALPEVTFTFKGANWLLGNACATDLTASNLAVGSVTNFSPIPGYAGRLMVQTNGTTTYTGATQDVNAVVFEPQIKYEPVSSPSGTNSVLRWIASRASGPALTGNFQSYFADYTRFNWKTNRTSLAVWYQIGTLKGQTILIAAPTVQVTDVQRIKVGSIAGEQVNFKARNDGDTTEVTASDLGQSPFRIHFL